MSIQKLLNELNKNKEVLVHFIVAPQVVLSISRAYGIPPTLVFAELNRFFKQHFNTGVVLDLWEGIIHCHELILAEYLQSK
jgi:iron only hydrogenase large subunit-like protein